MRELLAQGREGVDEEALHKARVVYRHSVQVEVVLHVRLSHAKGSAQRRIPVVYRLPGTDAALSRRRQSFKRVTKVEGTVEAIRLHDGRGEDGRATTPHACLEVAAAHAGQVDVQQEGFDVC